MCGLLDGVPKDHFQAKGKLAEEFVHNLALSTFLTDWCYLNPLLPDGKELCDLLIVFDHIAIIWEIKDLKLDEQGRYKKAEVEKNLRQLAGARRQLFELKRNIELVNPRRGKELFDPAPIKAIFLISVLMGEGQEASSFMEEIKNHTVHVFARDFVRTALRELDTVRDFCDYLSGKENFLAQKKAVAIQGGEEELLGVYLLNDLSFEWAKDADSVFIAQGTWEKLQNKPEYARKKKADEISYGWDHIVDRLHESGSAQYETVARELARHTRFERRFLSQSFYDAHVKAHETDKPIFRRALAIDGVTYCFLFVDKAKPRELRRKILEIFCFVARGKFPQNQAVIGISTEKELHPEDSYDVLWLKISEWREEHQKRMEELQASTETLTNASVVAQQFQEYPEESRD